MLPDEALSSVAIASPLQPPDDIETLPTEAWEIGGVALNDGSKGLQYQNWHATTDGTSIYLKPDNGPQTTLISGLTDVTEVDVTFDANMNWCACYVASGVPYISWYDTAIPARTVLAFPAGALNPRCTLDDKRDLESALRSIIVGFVLDGNLHYLDQNDRFTVDRTIISTGKVRALVKIGMDTRYRLQFITVDEP